MTNLKDLLTPEKGLIFRITHVQNIAWILKNGLHCESAELKDPNFVSIGNPELIERRKERAVPIEPGGVLSDYVPFYFTPFSPMFYNIRTGYGGITPRANEEIVILVASLREIHNAGLRFVFTDRHAYLNMAHFSSEIENLDEMIDYRLLRRRDFKKDPENPGTVEKYQAEALIHHHLPLDALLGIACHNSEVKSSVESEAKALNVEVKALVRKEWYF